MIHITYLIPSLGIGGSETMLLKLAEHTNRQKYQLSVITFWQENILAVRFNALGIKVYQLNRPKSIFPLQTILQLRHILRQLQPDLVHAWLYPAFLFSLAIVGRSFRPKIIWNIRHAPDCIESSTGKILGWFCKKMVFYMPDAVVCCSQKAAQAHQVQGWQTPMYCIPNGFVLKERRPTKAGNEGIRIGKIARFATAKDHETFIRAAAIFKRSFPQAHFILCGKNCDVHNPSLVHCLAQHAVQEAFTLLGEQSDMATVISQLHICTLSSFTEGFPNVLGEAISQGVMSIATEAGDIPILLGDKQWVTPIGDAQALALAWQNFISLTPTQQVLVKAHQYERLQQYFDIQKIVQKYEQLYDDLVDS